MKSWRDNIRNVVPYTPGEQPKEDGVIKLNTNENPYPPSPKVLEAINHIKHLRKYLSSYSLISCIVFTLSYHRSENLFMFPRVVLRFNI